MNQYEHAITKIMQELNCSKEDAEELFQSFARKKWGLERGIRTVKLSQRWQETRKEQHELAEKK